MRRPLALLGIALLLLGPAAPARAQEAPSPPAAPAESDVPTPWPPPPDFHGGPLDVVAYKFSGYLQVDSIQDFGNAGDPFVFTPSTIPVDGGSTSQVTGRGALVLGPYARITTRRTRVGADVRLPGPDFTGGTRFYTEGDFYGRDGAPRLRHLYVEWPYLTVGLTFSAFRDGDAEVDTLDLAGPNATIGRRQQGVRLVAPWRGGQVALGLEESGGLVSPTGFVAADDGLRVKPDIAGHVRHDFGVGHLQVSGVLRDLRTTGFTSANERFTGWGTAVTGRLFLDDERRDRLQAALTFGEGLGNYVSDLSGTGSELGLDAQGLLGTQFASGGYLGYQHWWDEGLRSSLYYSYVQVDLRDGQPSDSYRRGQNWGVNVMWDLDPHWMIGAEFMNGSRQDKDGDVGTASRLLFSTRYSF